MQVHGVGARHAKLCSSRYPRHCSEESGGGGVRRLWLRTLSDALGGQRRKPTDAFGGDGGRVRRQRRAVWADASAALGGDRGRAPRPEFALHGYFDALRVELYARSIAVQLVCPGPVRSDLTKHVHGSDAGDSQAGGDRGGGGGGGGVGGGVVGGRRGSSGKLVVAVVVVVDGESGGSWLAVVRLAVAVVGASERRRDIATVAAERPPPLGAAARLICSGR